MRIVFQEPYESLDPRMRAADLIAEPLILHRPGLTARERRARALELMDRVRLARQLADRRPRELSGGQQQRVSIARAIVTEPKFVVLDEPTSALDMSIRAQILDLLLEFQREQRFSYLFISHDLTTIQYSCDNVAVMYLGRIVEYGPAAQVFADPKHPYTKALLSAMLLPDVDDVPHAADPAGRAAERHHHPARLRLRSPLPVRRPRVPQRGAPAAACG